MCRVTPDEARHWILNDSGEDLDLLRVTLATCSQQGLPGAWAHLRTLDALREGTSAEEGDVLRLREFLVQLQKDDLKEH